MALFAQAVEGVRIALGALRTNLLRTSLTTLGVVVGIAFVILMGWFLQGLDKALNDTISLFGDDVLYIDKFDWSGREDWDKMRNRKDITLAQAEEVEQLLTTPQTVVPTVRKQGIQVKRDNLKISNTTLLGTLSTYAPLLGDQVAEGRFLSPIEDHFRQNVVVIGFALAGSLFPNDNPIGQEVKIKGRNFTVIGVLKKRATFMFKEVDNELYIPLKSYLSIFGGGSSLTIAVKAGGEDRMDEVRAETIGVMRRVRNLNPGEKEDFGLNEAQQFRDQIATLRVTVWSAGIGLTALSFIVGVIGIINIMFVAVTERTKEIGIRKALGAPKRTIVFQFLVESATLGLMGALVAFVFCSVLMLIITTAFEWASFLPTFISLDLLLIATVVSVLVGIIAGVIPAFRAARMDPVMALRFD